MSSFRPLKILCEITKRQGSTFFNARNFCKDRGVEERLLILPKTNCVENSHEPKTNPQYLSPPEPANTGWWSFWGGGTKPTKSNRLPPPQDKIFTCVNSDTPHAAVSVESKPLFSWYASTWVSFLNKFGIQQVGETEQDTCKFPGQEQAVCETREDGIHSFTPYMGNDSQLPLCANQVEWLSLQDFEVSQPCIKCDGPSLHTQEVFQTAQVQQIENQANIDFQESPVLHTQMECNGSLPHRHITQPPQYSKKICSVQGQYRPFLKGRDLDGALSSRFYSTDHAPIHPDDMTPLSAETLASETQATPPTENKPMIICIEKPFKPHRVTESLVPSELSNPESHIAVDDDSPSIIAEVAEEPPLPTSMEMSPSGTKEPLQLDDSSSGNIISLEMPLSTPMSIITDSVKSPTNSTSVLVMMAMDKLPSSNTLTVPTIKTLSNIQSPLPEAIKKKTLPSSQTLPTKCFSSSSEVALPRAKKKPPSMHKRQPSSKSIFSTTKALDKAKTVTNTRSQTPMKSKASSSITKVRPVKAKTQKRSSPERLPTYKPYSSTTKTLHKGKCKTSSSPQRSISPKPFSPVTKVSLPEVKIKPPSIPVKLPPFKTFSSTIKTLDNAKNRTPTKLQKPSTSKTFPSTTKTPLPEVKKPPSNPIKLPASEVLSSTSKSWDNAKNRTPTKLQTSFSSIAFPSTTKPPLSEAKIKPSSIPVKLPASKTVSSTTKTLDNAKNRTTTKLEKPSLSNAFPSTTKTPLPKVKKKPSSNPVKLPAPAVLSSTSKSWDNAKNRTPTKLQTSFSSTAFPSITKPPLSEAKKKPSSIPVKLPASKTLSSTSKSWDNAKNRPPTKLQKPSSSKAFPSTTKPPLFEVKKKPSSIPVKLPACKTLSSTSKSWDNAKNRPPTKLQKPSSTKAFPSTTKPPPFEVKKKPSPIPLKLPASKMLSSTSKSWDNAKSRTPTKQNPSSSKAFLSTIKTPLPDVKKKPSSIPVKLATPRTLSSTSKLLDNAKNRTPTKLQKLSSPKACFPTTKAPLPEVKKKLPSRPVKLSGTKTFSSSTKILNTAKNSPLTKFQNSPASKAFSSSSKATLSKTKQILPLSKTPKHEPQYDKQMPSSFANVASSSRRFSSSTKAPFSHSKTVQACCGQMTQRSEAFCSTTTTELRNLKRSPPTNIQKMPSSKSFSSITQASLSNLNKVSTSRTEASYSVITDSTKTYPLPIEKNALRSFVSSTNSELTAESQLSSGTTKQFFNSSRKKPPSSEKPQSPSGAINTAVGAAFYSTDKQSSAAASDEKDPLKNQSASKVNKVKDQSHCRRRMGECLPPPKGQRKSVRPTPPEHIRVCPTSTKTIKKEASCKALRLPGCTMPTTISCLKQKPAERRQTCTKRLPPKPSFSECVRELPKLPFPTECCTSERFRYLQPSEPMFFPRSITAIPPVVEPYIDPCKGECCTPITVSRDAGNGDSLCNDIMGKKHTRDLAKAAVYECLFQGKKLMLPGCMKPKSTVCTATVAVRERCTRPLAPVPSFSECNKRPFPKRPFTECRLAEQRAKIMADVLARGLRLTLEAIFEARCKKPGLTKTCDHFEDEDVCGPTTPPRDCAKELPKSKPNRSCTEKVVEKCHAVPYKMPD